VYGRSPYADVHPSTGQPPRCVEIETHADGLAVTRCDHVVQKVDLIGRVDHHRDRGGECRVGGQLPQAGAMRGRVSHEHIVRDAAADEPDRLRQGVGHHALPPGPLEHATDEITAAYGLAGHPDWRTRGRFFQRRGVGVERRQIDHREGRIECGGGRIKPRLECDGPIDTWGFEHGVTLSPGVDDGYAAIRRVSV
jgi:hypothetical protein